MFRMPRHWAGNREAGTHLANWPKAANSPKATPTLFTLKFHHKMVEFQGKVRW